MTAFEPEQGFREALTMLDVGEVDLIVTMADDAVQWAKDHGYRIVVAEQDGNTIYEIRPGDQP